MRKDVAEAFEELNERLAAHDRMLQRIERSVLFLEKVMEKVEGLQRYLHVEWKPASRVPGHFEPPPLKVGLSGRPE